MIRCSVVMFFHSFLIQFQNFLIEQFPDILEGYIRENGADYNVISHGFLLAADLRCKIKDFFFHLLPSDDLWVCLWHRKKRTLMSFTGRCYVTHNNACKAAGARRLSLKFSRKMSGIVKMYYKLLFMKG